MAARKTLVTSPLTRDRIRIGMLVSRLESLAEGSIEMPPHAVTAALGLLKKVMPDLQATTISGDPENPLTHRVSLDGLNETQLRALASIKLGD